LSLPRKFALISYSLPPSSTPHGAIIHRLLRDLDASKYCLLSSSDEKFGDKVNEPDHLPGPYYQLPPPFEFTRGYKWGLKSLRERANVVVGLMSRARAIARILRRERCDAVIVCTGGQGILDFPAAYIASRLVGARFYAYLLDQYLNMVKFAGGSNLLARLEGVVVKGAATVIAPSEFLGDEIRRRYGVEPVVVHHPCDVGDLTPPRELGSGSGNGEIRIVYTGSVGELYAEGLRNLVAALDRLGRDDLRLHMYCRQTQAECESMGVRGRVTFHGAQPMSAMPAIQRGADILFLPLAFNTPLAEHLRTSSPGKMGEFLASGRPILIHTPPDSFTTWYFRHYDCGVVVDQNDPSVLAEGLLTIVNDPGRRAALGTRAWERARADFDVAKVRAQFFSALDDATGKS
jgi:glycosyltransferase involved in cell wall biosynthesis